MQFGAYTFVETRRDTRRIEPLPPSPMRSEPSRGAAVPTGRPQTRVSLQSSTNFGLGLGPSLSPKKPPSPKARPCGQYQPA